MSLFYSALEQARNNPKPPDKSMPIPEYLAMVTIGVKQAEERIRLGRERCIELLNKGSMNEISEMLICFSDFFSYIY